MTRVIIRASIFFCLARHFRLVQLLRARRTLALRGKRSSRRITTTAVSQWYGNGVTHTSKPFCSRSMSIKYHPQWCVIVFHRFVKKSLRSVEIAWERSRVILSFVGLKFFCGKPLDTISLSSVIFYCFRLLLLLQNRQAMVRLLLRQRQQRLPPRR